MGNERRFDFWSGIPCLTPRIARVSQDLLSTSTVLRTTIQFPPYHWTLPELFFCVPINHNSRTMHDSSCAYLIATLVRSFLLSFPGPAPPPLHNKSFGVGAHGKRYHRQLWYLRCLCRFAWDGHHGFHSVSPFVHARESQQNGLFVFLTLFLSTRTDISLSLSLSLSLTRDSHFHMTSPWSTHDDTITHSAGMHHRLSNSTLSPAQWRSDELGKWKWAIAVDSMSFVHIYAKGFVHMVWMRPSFVYTRSSTAYDGRKKHSFVHFVCVVQYFAAGVFFWWLSILMDAARCYQYCGPLWYSWSCTLFCKHGNL